MKLSQNLPQFKDDPTLIITAGWQSGKIFYAVNGKIVLDKEIKIPNRRYSDQAGFLKTRTPSGDVSPRGGAVHEEDKQRIRGEFLDKFSEHIKKLICGYKIKSIYIFSSQQGRKSLKDNLSPEVAKLIKEIYEGNYTHYKPDKLAELIKNKQSRPVQIMKEEAKKILDRAKRIFRK